MKKDQVNCYTVSIKDKRIWLNSQGIVVNKDENKNYFLQIGRAILGMEKRFYLPVKTGMPDICSKGTMYRAKIEKAKSKWMDGMYLIKKQRKFGIT